MSFGEFQLYSSAVGEDWCHTRLKRKTFEEKRKETSDLAAMSRFEVGAKLLAFSSFLFYSKTCSGIQSNHSST